MEELAAAVRNSVEGLAAGRGGAGGGAGAALPSTRGEVVTLARTDDVHSITLRVENRDAARLDMCRPVRVCVWGVGWGSCTLNTRETIVFWGGGTRG